MQTIEQAMTAPVETTVPTVLSTQESLKHGGMGMDEIVLPRLRILKDAKDGFAAGSLIDNVSGNEWKNLFIPLFVFNNYIEFDGMRIKRSSMDRTEPWVSEGLDWKEVLENGFKRRLKPTVTQVISFVGYDAENFALPVVAGFKRTSLKAGKRFYTNCFSQGRGVTLIEGTFFSQFNIKHRYALVSKKVEDKNYGSYYTLEFALPKTQEEFNIPDLVQKELWDLAKGAAVLVGALSAEAYGTDPEDGPAL